MNRLALGMALVIGFAVPADARRIVPNTHPFPAWLREIIDRTKADAERRETRELAAELAKAGRIDAASMGRHQKATVDVRRDIFQLRGEDQPLKGVRLVEVAEFVLLHDPDENVRTHAACGLGYSGLSLESRAGAVLAQALKDTSAGVRSFACQALHQRGEKARVAAIRPLLQDEVRDVRMMAVTALGRLGDTESMAAILKVYESEQDDPKLAYTFAESLGRLGEKKISLLTAQRAMASDNWNVRFFGAEALAFVDSVDVIPAAMACLDLEVARILNGEKHTGFDERIYQKLVAILAERTKKDLGFDPAAWADWWDKARVPYFAPALEIDAEAAKQAYAEHLKLKAAK